MLILPKLVLDEAGTAVFLEKVQNLDIGFSAAHDKRAIEKLVQLFKDAQGACTTKSYRLYAVNEADRNLLSWSEAFTIPAQESPICRGVEFVLSERWSSGRQLRNAFLEEAATGASIPLVSLRFSDVFRYVAAEEQSLVDLQGQSALSIAVMAICDHLLEEGEAPEGHLYSISAYMDDHWSLQAPLCDGAANFMNLGYSGDEIRQYLALRAETILKADAQSEDAVAYFYLSYAIKAMGSRLNCY